MSEHVEDPWAITVDEENPWATPEDVKTGSFEPTPFFDSLSGRLVAFVPRFFEKEAKKRADRVEPGGATTEERYTVDMVVLDGGELRYWYNKKVEGQEERVPTEHVIPASDLPKLYTGVWRTEGNVVGQLKKIDGSARPILLGRVVRGPQKADRDKGVTPAKIQKAYAEWEKRGKTGPKPKFSWIVDVDITDADRALATKWYVAAKADGFTV